MAKRKATNEERPAKPEPHSFEKARIKQATAFAHAKADAGKIPPRVEYDEFGENKVLNTSSPHSDKVGHLFAMHHVFGTGSQDFQRHQFGKLLGVMRSRGEEIPTEHSANAAIAAVAAVEPQNEIEAMLAVQMAGTHEVAMEMLSRAKSASDNDQLERYGSLATKLLRTYTTQLEALAKFRRGGSQRVTVEHVHVHAGGQAIVGHVNTSAPQPQQGGRGHQETGHQPHALTGPAALAFQADPEMLRADAGRETVPVTSGEREDTMPDARRRQGNRGSER